MVSESARYYQTHPAARERKKNLLLLRRLSVGNWLVITLPTIRSMGQLLAKVWMLAIRNQESGINHHFQDGYGWG